MNSGCQDKYEPLDSERLRELVPGDIVDSVHILDSVGSTNTVLADWVNDGQRALPDFTVLTAEEQTSGKGRRSREWKSQKHTSLSTSFLLKPPALDELAWLVLLLAEAAVDTARRAGVPAAIKWPNDVVAAHESSGQEQTVKLGGILGQFVMDGDSSAIVVGIGLNILDKPQPTSDQSAPTVPGCFADFRDEAGDALLLDRTVLLGRLISRFHQNYQSWLQAMDEGKAGRLASQLIRPMMSTVGQLVKVTPSQGETYVAHAVGLNEAAELVVEHGQVREELNVADIVHLRPVGDLE